MATQPDVLFTEGLDFFSFAVDRLDVHDWQRPTPCDGWRTLDVLGHVGSAVQFGTTLLRGGQPEWAPFEPPGEGVEGEPSAWWESLVQPARRAVAGVNLATVVDSPAGRRSVGDGLSFPALDLFIHAWDLAISVGEELEIPAAVIEFTHQLIDPLPEETVRRGGVFAYEFPAPMGASPSQEFIAWTGRNPMWTRSPSP